ncbi:protein kinase domain-containing protein [Myxococcus xanthus]|uniref:Tyrosine protein kinase n=1 Tax=Myxococcus xanthus TaxID=34 RepID=A0AAE6FY44_MYXXA|nr:protein kinase [Myxococcus xanthus]QDE67156.1 tyrosine protein kinase [Myxococcus xanthus]QDE74431.1 tyrosine protein kinase [Myxococcus xanthus]QDE81718.1 tyrosine protein kinase [Myxococcus xanthus]QDE96017.1 tyrosine protein kinase [Myxococcus xanthus]
MSPPQTTLPVTEASLVPLLQPYGPYVLVRKLAEGGMAEIFLAKLLGADGFERNVVIKRMLPHLTNNPDFVEMFRDEARLAAKLAHPNIVQIQELGFAEGCYYICMEYLAGEDFSTTLRLAGRKRHYVPLPIVLRVLIDAARGLHFAHEFTNEAGQPLNVVHRDISPSNLYLTYQGQVKVLDFGIAKAESRLVNTRTGVVKGKYMYMAPEQARGKEVDRRADVFALGVSLYEALTHVRPFSRENDLAVLNALLQGELKPPRELRPDLPEELEAILLKAMAFKPEDRYPTAEAFADALETFLSEHLSGSGAMPLGAFLKGHFGEERFTERSRIPTLATLTATYGGAAAGAQGQAPGAETHGTNLYGVLAREGDATSAQRPGMSMRPSSPGVPAHGSASRGPTSPEPATTAGGRRWRTLAVGLAGGLMLAAAGIVGYRQWVTTPASVSLVPATAPVVEAVAPEDAAAQAGSLPEAVANGAGGDVAVTDSAPPPVDAADATETDEAGLAGTASDVEPDADEEVADAAPVRSKKASSQKRVTLGIDDVQRVVSRGRARITTCFERYKADLPSSQGEVQVQLTIVSSGKVRAGTRGPLASSGVGRCLEAQAERLRFPPHRDQEVTVVMPFSWRVTQ